MSFAAALARADAAVSGMVDETDFIAVSLGGVSTGHRRDVNAAPTRDHDRPDFPFRGTIDLEPSFNSFNQANQVGPSSLAMRHVSTICITALVSGWAWVPRQGDEIRSGEAVYSVAAVDRDGTGRAAFWVNRKG